MYEQLVQYLAEEVVGQPEAVRAFARAAVRTMAPAGASDRPPLAVILVGGPTGTGKRRLSQVLARRLLGSERALIKLHPALYANPGTFLFYLHSACAAHDAAFGPVPGAPRVIYLEGIEKCPPPVLDTLLHLLSHGEISLTPDWSIDFGRTILILETAAAQREVDDLAERPSGFRGSALDDRESIDERIRQEVDDALRSAFPPQFFSMLDEIVYFRRLADDDLPFILDNMLSKLQARLTPRGLHLHVDEPARELLLEWGRRHLRFGAKALQQVVDRYLGVPVADAMISAPHMAPGSVLFARRTMEGIVLYVPNELQRKAHALDGEGPWR